MLLTTTPAILAASVLAPSPDHPKSLSDPISHATLIALARKTSSLNTLLRGTRPYVAPKPKPAQTEEYKALMAHLRAQEERREYLTMTAQTETLEERDDISPTLVLNMVLSVVMCAVAAFVVARWWNDAARVLFSLGVAVVVGVAEVGVYAAYLKKVDEARAQERKKKEKKEVIGEFDGMGVDAWGTESVQTERIWGKGKHGGMRRRVREKWEQEQSPDQ